MKPLFSGFFIVVGIAGGAIIGLILSILLFLVGIGVDIPQWVQLLSFGGPVIIGYIIGLIAANRDEK